MRMFLACILCLNFCATVHAQNRNIRFGKPATSIAHVELNSSDFHIERDQYVLSHNSKTGLPNWVSWNLRKQDIGDIPRGAFERDAELPKPSNKISASWYENTGFDIGHMCPSKDRSAKREDNDATFLMSNVVPQAPVCNEQTWKALEETCRQLAIDGHSLHIVCGPSGTRGQGKNGWHNSIKDGKVNVPAHLWKVVIVLDKQKNLPSKNTRVISVIVPNTQTVDKDWRVYRCSVKQVEELSGWKVFPLAPIDRDKVDAEKVE